MKITTNPLHQDLALIRPEQRLSWIMAYLCCSSIVLGGCSMKPKEIDYGEIGKQLTHEEILASEYIDRQAINYEESDQITFYSMKDGQVRYDVERSYTDQQMKDMLARYQSIVDIFGRLYNVEIGQRYIEGVEDVPEISYFDFEAGNETAVDYFKTNITYRSNEGKTMEERTRVAFENTILNELNDENVLIQEEVIEVEDPQTIQSIELEFAFTIQEGQGLFDITEYPAVLELLNAVREVNLTADEVSQINEQARSIMMRSMASAQVASDLPTELNTVNDSFTIERGAFTETFRVTPEAPHQVIFNLTLTDLLEVDAPIPAGEKA